MAHRDDRHHFLHTVFTDGTITTKDSRHEGPWGKPTRVNVKKLVRATVVKDQRIAEIRLVTDGEVAFSLQRSAIFG